MCPGSTRWGPSRPPRPPRSSTCSPPSSAPPSPSSRSADLRGSWVARLVHADLASPGEPEPSDSAPPLLGDLLRELDAKRAELRDRRVDVIAHEVELV